MRQGLLAKTWLLHSVWSRDKLLSPSKFFRFFRCCSQCTSYNRSQTVSHPRSKAACLPSVRACHDLLTTPQLLPLLALFPVYIMLLSSGQSKSDS